MRWMRTTDASFRCFHLKPLLRPSFGRHHLLLSTSPPCHPGPRPLFGLPNTLNRSGQTRWARGAPQWLDITVGGLVHDRSMRARLRIASPLNESGRGDLESPRSRTEVASAVVHPHVCCSLSTNCIIAFVTRIYWSPEAYFYGFEGWLQ